MVIENLSVWGGYLSVQGGYLLIQGSYMNRDRCRETFASKNAANQQIHQTKRKMQQTDKCKKQTGITNKWNKCNKQMQKLFIFPSATESTVFFAHE